MGKFIDLTGQRFNKLTVLKQLKNDACNKKTWLCKCDCGNKKRIRGADLKNNRTKSCGCLRITHGLSKNILFPVWQQIIQRCNNPNNKQYKNYGKRKIKVCWRWSNKNPKGFANFLKDVGEKPSPNSQIDRINNNKGYSPKNWRWATPEQQARNTRHNHLLKYNEKEYCLAKWEEVTGIKQATIRYRIKKGWSVKKALTTPVKQWRKKNVRRNY
jgi:hypothetical protein